MSSSTVDPNTWLSLDLSKRGQEQLFMQQLVQYCQYLNSKLTNVNNQFSASNIASLLNGGNLLTAGSVLVSGQNLGTLAANTTFDCKGALINVVVFTFSAAITLTLQHLAIGSMVVMQVTCGPTGHVLKFAATTPTGTAYTSIPATYSGGGTILNMITTGQAYSANVTTTFVGGSLTGPALPLVSA